MYASQILSAQPHLVFTSVIYVCLKYKAVLCINAKKNWYKNCIPQQFKRKGIQKWLNDYNILTQMLFSSLYYLLCQVIPPVWHLHDWEPISYPTKRKAEFSACANMHDTVSLRYISVEWNGAEELLHLEHSITSIPRNFTAKHL